MKLPSLSNSITGGAGIDLRSGGVDRGCASPRGRLRIHTSSLSSIATSEPNPILHFAGTFGKLGSSWNCGNPPSPICGACIDAACSEACGDIRRAIVQTISIPIKTKPASTLRLMGFLLPKDVEGSRVIRGLEPTTVRQSVRNYFCLAHATAGGRGRARRYYGHVRHLRTKVAPRQKYTRKARGLTRPIVGNETRGIVDAKAPS